MTVRGIKFLDHDMTTLRGRKQTIRGFFSDILIQTNVEGQRQQLILRSEKGTDDRVFLIFNKAHKQAVQTLITDLKTRFAAVFPLDSLNTVKGERNTWAREMNIVNIVNTRENEDSLQNLF